MNNRFHLLLLALIIVVSATAWPGQVSEIRANWPVIRLWEDPDAQMTELLGDVPYQGLKTAAEQLAPDVTILLVTSGDDVRRREYTTYHRALYLFAPRPVWWLSPAPSDGTWESRWWISGPLTAENVGTVAAEKSADCLLLIDVPTMPEYGTSVGQIPGAKIIQVGSKTCLAENSTPVTEFPVPLWPIRLLLAVLVVLALGFGSLAFVGRLNGRISGLETISLAWLFGAGLLTTLLLWFNGLGLSLDSQLIVLSISGVLLLLWQRRFILRSMAVLKPDISGLRFNGERLKQTAVLILVAFLVFQLFFVVIMAVGRPLTIWDSWVNWGSKGRLIFLENGITPALYADPSRQVMLLGYPPAIPLLEAWLYKWLGAADDRLVGVLFVVTYIALGSMVYGFTRRRRAAFLKALLLMGATLSIGHIVGLTASAFTDVWLSVLLIAAAIYLVEWLENGQTGYLLISAVAAGLLSWIKQEGSILIFALLAAFLLTFLLNRTAKSWRYRRAIGVCGLIGLMTILFGLPWRLFAAREAVLVSVFMPLTVDNLLANLGRVPVILTLIGRELVNPRTGMVWLLVPAILLGRRFQFWKIIKRPSVLFLLVPIFYLTIMAVPYIFSDFVPYQQHVLSSFFRINAHVLLLPLLWIGVGKNDNEQ